MVYPMKEMTSGSIGEPGSYVNAVVVLEIGMQSSLGAKSVPCVL